MFSFIIIAVVMGVSSQQQKSKLRLSPSLIQVDEVNLDRVFILISLQFTLLAAVSTSRVPFKDLTMRESQTNFPYEHRCKNTQ